MAPLMPSRSSAQLRRASPDSSLAPKTATTAASMMVGAHHMPACICANGLAKCISSASLRAVCWATPDFSYRGRSPAWARTIIPSTALQKKVDLRSQCCAHAELSFGCASYLIRRPEGNVLLDVPRYVPKLVNRIKVLPCCLGCASMMACCLDRS